MKPQIVFILLVFAVFVSCEKVRILQSNTPSPYKLNCQNFDQTTGTCLQCFVGCTKWENICVKIVKHCTKWDNQGNCTDCQTDYGDESNKSINGSCPVQPTPNNTLTNITVGTGTTPSPVSTTVDVNCQCHTEDRVCIYCFAGFYLDVNETCQEIPVNCTAANSLGQCTGCIQGFVVENGQCVEKICDKSLCVAYNADQTQCITCPQRSYLENGCCYEVNGYCSSWVQSTGECTACYQGYTINPANTWQCILSSP